MYRVRFPAFNFIQCRHALPTSILYAYKLKLTVSQPDKGLMIN